LLLLENPIQNYAWGSRTELSKLLGRQPATQPEAELWIGAHPKAPSSLSDGRSLLEAIRSDPEGLLGGEVQRRFGDRLPFLLKVLAVDAPLSLQAHPNLEQARAGFSREQAAGIPLDAAERTYKDDNHKPELLCALTPFEVLCGFRSAEEAARLFETLGLGRSSVVTQLRQPGPEPLRAAFHELMSLTGAAKAELLGAVIAGCERALPIPSPFAASLRWAVSLAERYPGDIGAVASLFLNHLTLAPLQALYLEAGRLHAYLRGTGVEIMANSDNVLRGGLTPKFVDVPELLRVLCFDSPEMRPVTASPGAPGEHIYQTPAAEFQLARVEVTREVSFTGRVNGPEVLLCVEGQVQVELTPGSTASDAVAPALAPRPLRRGQACFLPGSSSSYRLRGNGRVFRATVAALP
jgi:mannose-6-phosphate isomerase